MKQERNRPLTARSVIASTLLGTEGLAIPTTALVRAGELFGIAEGTIRVALSRMAANGELEAGSGRYRLTGPLVERSVAQEAGRRPAPDPWLGEWQLAVVTSARREAGDRTALRSAMSRLHLAEWREGVWLRPHNLGGPERLPEAARVAGEQCTWLTARLSDSGVADAELAAQLWDLRGWGAGAEQLAATMAAGVPDLENGDSTTLRNGFLLAAAVLRHLAADPLLPESLLPAAWPGTALRRQYDTYEAALQGVLRTWFRSPPAGR